MKTNPNFLSRATNADPDVLRRRLARIGFQDKQRVLDAGCGYGQWLAPLANLNEDVFGIDIDADKLALCVERGFAKREQLQVGDLVSLPYSDGSFDAIFCYSTIYNCDEREVVREFRRVIADGGLLYINYNDVGWYVYSALVRSIARRELDYLRKSYIALLNGFLDRRSRLHYVREEQLLDVLQCNGFEVMSSGGDGSASVGRATPGDPFYRGGYFGLSGVREVLAVASKKRA